MSATIFARPKGRAELTQELESIQLEVDELSGGLSDLEDSLGRVEKALLECAEAPSDLITLAGYLRFQCTHDAWYRMTTRLPLKLVLAPMPTESQLDEMRKAFT